MVSFSVIVPNYNHAPFLRERIESILNQSYPEFELIILDDASTDHSKAIIEEFRDSAKISHIKYSDSNSGSPFLQWQKGIRLAKNPWIWMAESDDMANTNFLEKANTAIISNPEIVLFYSDSLIIDSNDFGSSRTFAPFKNKFFSSNKWSHSHLSEGSEDIRQYFSKINIVNNSSAAVFNKEVSIKAIDGLSKFKYYGDWYFFMHLANEGKLYYQNDVLSKFRRHSNSQLNRNIDPLQQRIEYFYLLNYLYQLPYITDKKSVIRFFALQYLNMGILTEAKTFGLKLYNAWNTINPSLAKQVTKEIIACKLSGKKPVSLH